MTESITLRAQRISKNTNSAKALSEKLDSKHKTPLRISAAKLEEVKYQPAAMDKALERAGKNARRLRMAAMMLTVFWLSFSTFLIIEMMLGTTPDMAGWGGMIAGLLAPVAFLWMIVGQMTNNAQASYYAQALRSELEDLIFPSSSKHRAISSDIQELCKQATQVAQASKAGYNAIQSARNGLHEEIKSFASLARKSEGHYARITQNVSAQIAELHALEEKLKCEGQRIESRANGTVQSWNNAITQIEQQSREMEATLNEAGSSLVSVASDLETKTSVIEGKIAISDERLTKLNAQCRSFDDVGTSITDRLERLIGDMEAHGVSITSKVDEVSEAHIKLANLLPQWVEQGNNFKKVSGALSDASAMIEEALEKGDAKTTAWAQKVTDEIIVLDRTAGMYREKLDDILAMTKQSNASFDDASAGYERAASRSEEQHKQLILTLETQSEALSEAGNKALEKAEQVAKTLAENTDTIRDQAGDIAHDADKIETALKSITATATTQASDSVKAFDDLRTTMARTHDDLQAQSQTCRNDIKGYVQELQTITQDMTTQNLSQAQQWQTMVQDTKTNAVNIADQLEKSGMSFEHAQTRLQKAAESTLPEMDALKERAEKTYQTMQSLKQPLETLRDETLNRLDESTKVFNERTEALKEQATASINILDKSSDAHRAQIKLVSEDSAQMYESLDKAMKALEESRSEVSLTTDRATLKLESIAGAVKSRMQDIDENISIVIKKLDDAGNDFESTGTMVTAQSDTVLQRFESMNERSEDVMRMIGERSYQAMQRLSAEADNFGAQMEDLGTIAVRNTQSLQEQAVLFKKQAAEIENHSRTIMTLVKDSRESSVLEMDDLGKAVRTQTKNIAVSMDDLKIVLKDVGIQNANHVKTIETAGAKARSEAIGLKDIVGKIGDSMQRAGSVFGTQLDNLTKTSQNVEDQIERLQNASQRKQRADFLATSKFIVESLHSLSLDFTRLLDGDLEEARWKSYKAGDIAVFTRRFTQGGQSFPLDKASEKYLRDSEFRSYVEKFLRQFEDMYQQAMEQDHGAILAGTFASAEIGTLYLWLCEVAGRTPKTTSAKVA